MMTRDQIKALTWRLTPQNGERARYMAVIPRSPTFDGRYFGFPDPDFECESFRCSLSMMREVPGLIEHAFDALDEIDRLREIVASLEARR